MAREGAREITVATGKRPESPRHLFCYLQGLNHYTILYMHLIILYDLLIAVLISLLLCFLSLYIAFVVFPLVSLPRLYSADYKTTTGLSCVAG